MPMKKVNHQKLIIFEGFRPNGLQIRNRHIFYIGMSHRFVSKSILAIWVKMTHIDSKLKEIIIIELFRLWEYEKTIYHGQNLLGAYIKAYFGLKTHFN